MKPFINFAVISIAVLTAGEVSADVLCKNRAGVVYNLKQCTGRFQAIDAESLQGPTSSDCSPYVGSHSFVYAPIQTTAGQDVTIPGYGFPILMVTVPFMEYKSGIHYAITYPVQCGNGGTVMCDTVVLTPMHQNQAWVKKCGATIANDVSVLGAITDRLIYAASGRYSYPPATYTSYWEVSNQQDAIFSVQVGDTFIQLSYGAGGVSQYSAIDKNLKDYTSTISWGSIVQQETNIQNLIKLMNYITIKRLN